ncbi:MAG: cupredoxin domain-containing protein [Nanoarchaeota archaeon]
MKTKYPIIILAALVILLGLAYYSSLSEQQVPFDDGLPQQDQIAVQQDPFIIVEESEDIIENIEQEKVMVSDEVPKEEVIYVTYRLFSPKTLTIEKGTTVRWINTDESVHVIKEVSANNLFRSERLNPGDSYTYKFNQPGEYSYIDVIKTFMSGKIIVKDDGMSPITGNVIGFSETPQNIATLLLFMIIGLTLIYGIHKPKK